MPAAVNIRLFAAARAAAGIGETTAAAGSLEAILAELVARYPALEEVLPRCSYLLNGAAVHGLHTEVPAGATVDILPPFAGG